MRKTSQALVLASAVAGIVAIISPLYAQETSPSAGPSKGTEMMGGGNMMGSNNMMGGNNAMGGNDMMMGMMNMMTQMNQMMESCNKMMQTSMDKDHGPDKPNDRPATPEKKS